MSLLEQQLKELQVKKQKVAYLTNFHSMLENISKPEEGSPNAEEIADAREEVIYEVAAFLKSRIDAIESGQESPLPEEGALSLTQEEIGVLKEMVVRLQRPPAPAPRQSQSPRRQQVQQNQGAFADEGEFDDEQEEPQQAPRRRQRPQPPQQPRGGRRDIVAFAMQHRGLDGKRVTFQSPGGQVIGGRVVGMEMPNIVVQTDTGHTIGIPPEELTVG